MDFSKIDFKGLDGFLTRIVDSNIWPILFIFSASVFFANHYYPLIFGFDSIVQKYLWLISTSLFLSCAFLVCRGGRFLTFKFLRFLNERSILLELNNLDNAEHEVLKNAVRNKSRTVTGHMCSPTLISLREKRIMDLPGASPFHENNAPFLIHCFVWEKIKNDQRFR